MVRDVQHNLTSPTGGTPGTMAVSDERFKLDDLISLGIHKYGEDVVAIVEKANKELQIDAALTKVWISSLSKKQ